MSTSGTYAHMTLHTGELMYMPHAENRCLEVLKQSVLSATLLETSQAATGHSESSRGVHTTAGQCGTGQEGQPVREQA